jgi:hypothetical protein
MDNNRIITPINFKGDMKAVKIEKKKKDLLKYGEGEEIDLGLELSERG